jgi:small subunit ribosomal protein S2
MAEMTPPGATTPGLSQDPSAAPAAGAAPSEMAAAMAEGANKTPLTVRSLLEAGAHFGHQTHRWNPRMKPFIFGERNGVHILDLDQTLTRFREALEFIRETSAAGGKVLFVGTKRQAAPAVEAEAGRAGQLWVNNRWLGGTLTNFRTVRKSLDRFKELLEILGNEEKSAELSKKELSRISREVDRHRKGLDGLREMSRIPAAMFVIDVNREHIAVSEAQRLGIPIVSVVDSNCSPDGIDFVIPANDDATRAVQLYCSHVADACIEGAQLHEERVRSEASTDSGARRGAEGAGPGTGRVVVEIKQPPRRGRGAGRGAPRGGTRSAGVERDLEPATPPAANPAAPAAPVAPAREGGDGAES